MEEAEKLGIDMSPIDGDGDPAAVGADGGDAEGRDRALQRDRRREEVVPLARLARAAHIRQCEPRSSSDIHGQPGLQPLHPHRLWRRQLPRVRLVCRPRPADAAFVRRGTTARRRQHAAACAHRCAGAGQPAPLRGHGRSPSARPRRCEAGVCPVRADHDGPLPRLLERSRLFEDLRDGTRRREKGGRREVLSAETRGKRARLLSATSTSSRAAG